MYLTFSKVTVYDLLHSCLNYNSQPEGVPLCCYLSTYDASLDPQLLSPATLQTVSDSHHVRVKIITTSGSQHIITPASDIDTVDLTVSLGQLSPTAYIPLYSEYMTCSIHYP